MRPLVLIGVVLIAIGGFLLYQGGTFKTRDKLLEVGDLKVTTTDKHAVPTWVAGVALVAGLGLVVAGAAQRKA
ncbi:MAG TPA: hypothetical protein VG817_07300 [Gemmatimonadales bacterium]|nr:hypothetical protein [Gemmatimonadales bacterium]